MGTDQPNLVTANEIHPSQHEYCHHQINFVKVNLDFILPEPTKRFIWHYARADIESMRRACSLFDWETQMNGLNPDEQVYFFDGSIRVLPVEASPNKKSLK